ncbi:MAG: LLM class flavin-dependent oxidoreductase [Phycicoccus sp.]|nr:LLM class flavin-dependent oxidoreductase [Phycicoccus sp.]
MSTGRLRLSLLDLAIVARGEPIGQALRNSIELAQVADRLARFERVWFAEHHNMPTIASAATSVLVGQVLAATGRIRVGSGGVMLPNHAPLVVAEQFGTLAELYPDRVDLGVGRAPGTDQVTLGALRRDQGASEDFPQDIRELQGYLGEGGGLGVNAYPGLGTRVPVWILGSSLFGARLAAAFGLPYAFASHFAPDALDAAMQVYRAEFRPSEQLQAPYAVAALNVVAADTQDEADVAADKVLRARVRALASRAPQLKGQEIDDALLDVLMETPLGAQAAHMVTYSAVGDADAVGMYLHAFRERTGADELMVTNPAGSLQTRVRTLEILATID